MSGLGRSDLDILRLLQRDALMPLAQIGERVSLSASAVSRRIDALKKSGYIQGQRVVLNHAQLGLNTLVFTLVSLKNHGDRGPAKFEEQVAATMPNVTECVRLCGAWDYLLRFVVRDMEHYGQLQQKLTALETVRLLRTHAAMGPVQTAPLPLE